MKCRGHLHSEQLYISTGWTIWYIFRGEVEYSINGSLRHGYTQHMLVLAPQDNIYILNYTDDLTISMLCVPPSLMSSAMRSESMKQKQLMLPVFLKNDEYAGMVNTRLSDKAKRYTHYIFSVLIDHVAPASPIVSVELAIPLVEAMIMVIMNDLNITKVQERPDTRREQIATNFMLSLQSNFIEHQDVAFYASQACVSAKYFTAIIKEQTKATPVEWINRMLTTRSRELLWNANMTISEISDHLGFSSPSVFVRFFHKRTGFTPKQYKANSNKVAEND